MGVPVLRTVNVASKTLPVKFRNKVRRVAP